MIYLQLQSVSPAGETEEPLLFSIIKNLSVQHLVIFSLYDIQL